MYPTLSSSVNQWRKRTRPSPIFPGGHFAERRMKTGAPEEMKAGQRATKRNAETKEPASGGGETV